MAEDAACKASALSSQPIEVPPCGTDHLVFDWQEPVQLAAVDVVDAKRDRLVVRAFMRYAPAFLELMHAPPEMAPHFFALIDLALAQGAWRVDGYAYDDEGLGRDRAGTVPK